ncbi:MAG TPA: sugar transferase [Rhizomicrobium sp.]|jgi:lipopolysaccharide/colanic/teichoic acid biosynthesis glycosyltransferase
MARPIGGKYAIVLEGSRVQSTDWRAGDERRADDFRITVTPATAPLGGLRKRCFDIVLSILLLPLVAILSVPIACLVALGGGSPIYGHLRVGWNGRPFRCYKFRTMVAEAEDELQAILERDPAARLQWLERFKLENDPRVTPLGRVLRYTSLDEIPQIWNVLCGEMSWVGPRPVIQDELSKYGSQISSYFACRPGVTGLWQIRRHSNTTYDERVAFDVDYAGNWSTARDIVILVRTIPSMFAARERE